MATFASKIYITVLLEAVTQVETDYGKLPLLWNGMTSTERSVVYQRLAPVACYISMKLPGRYNASEQILAYMDVRFVFAPK